MKLNQKMVVMSLVGLGLTGCFTSSDENESGEQISQNISSEAELSIANSSQIEVSSSSGQELSSENKVPDVLFETSDYTEAVFVPTEIEGPAVDQSGNLFVVNIKDPEEWDVYGTIGKVATDGSTEVFVRLPEGSKGNGLRFSKDYQTLFVADYKAHQILSVDMNTKEVSVLAKQETGMDQPNDIAIMDNGILFATDPSWADSTGKLWRVGADGKFVELESEMGTTNGVEVSPDNKTLYVNESIQRKIWKYDLSETGELSNKSLHIEFEDFGLDGMRVDAEGNLYVARFGAGVVAIVTPEGLIKKEVELTGTNPTNIAFGGEDGKTCYVTIQDRSLVETFRTDTPGRSFRQP